MKLQFFGTIIASVFLMSCAHSVHMVHGGDYELTIRKSGSVIEASAEQLVILGFAENTNYVDKAYQRLQEKCPNGQISGITTEFMTNLGFWSWTNKIFMRGICT